MIGVLIISHGALGESLIHAASHVLGKRPLRVRQVGVTVHDDPEAMLRHTEECRARGIRFVADPSQQLAFADGPFIRRLIDGADYLFTNEYESHLTETKTGWSQAEIDDRVTTRVITRGKDGADIRTKVCRGGGALH